MRPAIAALGCFTAGAVVVLLAHPDVLRLAGALLMLAAVFLGVVAIATPDLLGEDEEPRDDAAAEP